jgi:hypothetical protein
VTAGIWIAPLAVTGLAAILWVAARLEQLVASPAVDPGLTPVGRTGPLPADAASSQVAVDGTERAVA